MNRILFIFLAGFTIWLVFIKSDKVELGPGVMAPQEPFQEKIASEQSFGFEGYTITPLARFEIEAKVLSKENYSHGREADLSPSDLALGWGRMSDEAVLKSIRFSQSGRWYRWQTDAFPIPRREIELNSANMHIIPKDEAVESVLEEVRTGNIVHIRGYLVKVHAPDGWHWQSSLSREDTGNGACELIFAESIAVKSP